MRYKYNGRRRGGCNVGRNNSNNNGGRNINTDGGRNINTDGGRNINTDGGGYNNDSNTSIAQWNDIVTAKGYYWSQGDGEDLRVKLNNRRRVLSGTSNSNSSNGSFQQLATPVPAAPPGSNLENTHIQSNAQWNNNHESGNSRFENHSQVVHATPNDSSNGRSLRTSRSKEMQRSSSKDDPNRNRASRSDRSRSQFKRRSTSNQNMSTGRRDTQNSQNNESQDKSSGNSQCATSSKNSKLTSSGRRDTQDSQNIESRDKSSGNSQRATSSKNSKLTSSGRRDTQDSQNIESRDKSSGNSQRATCSKNSKLTSSGRRDTQDSQNIESRDKSSGNSQRATCSKNMKLTSSGRRDTQDSQNIESRDKSSGNNSQRATCSKNRKLTSSGRHNTQDCQKNKRKMHSSRVVDSVEISTSKLPYNTRKDEPCVFGRRSTQGRSKKRRGRRGIGPSSSSQSDKMIEVIDISDDDEVNAWNWNLNDDMAEVVGNEVSGSKDESGRPIIRVNVIETTSGSTTPSDHENTQLSQESHSVSLPIPEPEVTAPGNDSEDDPEPDVLELKLRLNALRGMVSKYDGAPDQDEGMSSQIGQDLAQIKLESVDVAASYEPTRIGKSVTECRPAQKSQSKESVSSSGVSSYLSNSSTNNTLNVYAGASYSSTISLSSGFTTAVAPTSSVTDPTKNVRSANSSKSTSTYANSALHSMTRYDDDEDVLRTEVLMSMSRKTASGVTVPTSFHSGLSAFHTRGHNSSLLPSRPVYLAGYTPQPNYLLGTTCTDIPVHSHFTSHEQSQFSNNSVPTYVSLESSKTLKTKQPFNDRTVVNTTEVRQRFQQRCVMNFSDYGNLMITVPNNIKPVIINLGEGETSSNESEEVEETQQEAQLKKTSRNLPPAPKKIQLEKDRTSVDTSRASKSTARNESYEQGRSLNQSSSNSKHKWKRSNTTADTAPPTSHTYASKQNVPELPPEFHASLSKLLASAKVMAGRTDSNKQSVAPVPSIKLADDYKHLPLEKQKEYLTLKSRMDELQKELAIKEAQSGTGMPKLLGSANVSTTTNSSPGKRSPRKRPYGGEGVEKSIGNKTNEIRNEKQHELASNNEPEQTSVIAGDQGGTTIISNSSVGAGTNSTTNTQAQVPLSKEDMANEREVLCLREQLLREKLRKGVETSTDQIRLAIREKELANARKSTIESLSGALTTSARLLEYKGFCRRMERQILLLQQHLKESNDSFRSEKYRMDSAKAELDASMKTIEQSKAKLEQLEEECKVLGGKVKGSSYDLPQLGKQEIAIKLSKLEKQSYEASNSSTVKIGIPRRRRTASLKLRKNDIDRASKSLHTWKNSIFYVNDIAKRRSDNVNDTSQHYECNSEDSEVEEVLRVPRRQFTDYIQNRKVIPYSRKFRRHIQLAASYVKYASPLQCVAGADNGFQELQFLGLAVKKINPAITMCSFEIRGICNAEACMFQHLYRPNPSY